jgi:endonuclease III
MVHTLVIVVCYLNPDVAFKVDKGEALVSQGLIYEFSPPKDQFCFKVLIRVLISNLKRDKAVKRAYPICECYVLELKPYL